MSRLRPEQLNVRFAGQATPFGPALPRRYTLTHSDRTGDLFLTVGTDYDHSQISRWYTRLMRDEVLAEWQDEEAGPALHVYCHVSGGLALGTSGMRFAIFQRELPLVLEAIRHGDKVLFESIPHLDGAPILVHFRAREKRYNRVENWGKVADFAISRDSHPASPAAPPTE
ncbi:MAG: staygreen family protein [Anaerolineae bacterium]|nr:staygreen family protein [Anaerolineae bacterium]